MMCFGDVWVYILLTVSKFLWSSIWHLLFILDFPTFTSIIPYFPIFCPYFRGIPIECCCSTVVLGFPISSCSFSQSLHFTALSCLRLVDWWAHQRHFFYVLLCFYFLTLPFDFFHRVYIVLFILLICSPLFPLVPLAY